MPDRDSPQGCRSYKRALAKLLVRSTLQFLICQWRSSDAQDQKEALAVLGRVHRSFDPPPPCALGPAASACNLISYCWCYVVSCNLKRTHCNLLCKVEWWKFFSSGKTRQKWQLYSLSWLISRSVFHGKWLTILWSLLLWALTYRCLWREKKKSGCSWEDVLKRKEKLSSECRRSWKI